MNVSNDTQLIGNHSAKNDNEANIQPVWGQYGDVTSVTALVILTGQIITFYGLVKLKRLPFATKFLICLNLALDCCFNVILIIASPVNRIFGQNDTVTDIGQRIGSLAMSGSWLCLAMLSIERFLCITYPNEYMRIVSKRRVVIASLACLIVLWIVKLCTRYLIMPEIYRQYGYSFEVSKDTDILTWILGICMILCLLCNGLVLRIVNRHKKQVLAQASTVGGGETQVKPLRGFKSTDVVWILNGIFVILYLPLFFVKLIRGINNRGIAALRSAEFVCMLITCVANPVVYAWRLKEFRYHILALLGTCNGRIANIAERERIVVYSITTKAMNPTGTSDTTL